jgi:hypothetical protein
MQRLTPLKAYLRRGTPSIVKLAQLGGLICLSESGEHSFRC